MSAEPAKNLKARVSSSESFALYVLFTLCIACALLLCALPRPLVPDDLPALRISRAQVAAVIAKDLEDEKHAPKIPSALELERLFLERGEAEDLASEDRVTAGDRQRALRAAYRMLLVQAGGDGVVAMRARELGKLEAAFDLRLPEEQLKGVMGSFANALSEYGVTYRGEELVPHFVVRTLYKVRWNRMMGIAADFAFADVEKLAFHGFLALQSTNLSIQDRMAHLDVYASLCGKTQAAHVAEAHGVLLFLAHEPDSSAAALQAAYEQTFNLKLRNYAYGAQTAALHAVGIESEAEESQENPALPAP